MTKVEYKVRKIERFIVTRFGDGVGSSQHGTFDNADTAYAVGYALCKAEHDRSGEPIDSDNFQYPRMEGDKPVVEVSVS